MAAGDPSPTWTDEDFLSSACPRCDAIASQPCKANVAPLTTGEGDTEWHEERRPMRRVDLRILLHATSRSSAGLLDVL